MASSHVTVNPSCVDTYQALKMKRNHKFITFKLSNDNTEIIVDQTSESSDYDDFLGSLPEDEPRWAVYDFQYAAPDGSVKSKLIFLSWSPDIARIKAKMVYATSKDALRRALPGIEAEIQGTESSDIAFDQVLDKVGHRA